MTNFKIGRWLLVTLAIVGLAVVAPAVGAHGTGPAADDAPPYDGDAEAWADWMETRMADHMGPGADEWMEAHMGATVEEMAGYMANGDGYGMHGPGGYGMHGPGGVGTSGPGSFEMNGPGGYGMYGPGGC